VPPSSPQLTAQTHHLICDLARDGLDLVTIAGAAGVGTRTLYRWVDSGRRLGRSPYAELWGDLCVARAERAFVVDELVAAARQRVATPR
jgi:hypothetical protein